MSQQSSRHIDYLFLSLAQLLIVMIMIVMSKMMTTVMTVVTIAMAVMRVVTRSGVPVTIFSFLSLSPM